MLTLEALRTYGANVDEGLGRCMNNEAFYLRLVGKVMQDGNFAKLEESLKAENWEAAFEAAHGLKGALGNLSLTPMYEPVEKLTERLRPRQACEYQDLLEAFLKARAGLEELVGA